MTRRRAIATFDGVSVGVTTSDSSLLGWLTEFLSPAVTWARGGSRRLRIDVVDDTARWRRWFRRGAAERDVSCFYLDTKIIHHPYWNAPVETPVVYDDEFRVFYRWRRADTIEILRQRRDPLGRLAVMRTLRDLFVAHTMGAGRSSCTVRACSPATRPSRSRGPSGRENPVCSCTR